ncbi:hypothetical protein FK535_27485 [Mycolicibacterium sp. 018/SC-01/001]|uniref:hypothetical protein n=1 Tax=Mycolicibacterium sp. 018/SC-01/001 TaxID=2592069 RepID=UPI00117E3484|nr:hypothetical protein [Mycolicibacterium sp. 018/SC-01/001]TRW76758.1 hypothetical protein FK535_27485 [Mycolicibacterium sp. 018/SC-01/001]
MSATVWSATFVPSPSPYPDFGQNGYSVAWIDTDRGRLQVLVDGARPSPGTSGRLIEMRLGEESIDVFRADAP